MQAAADPGFVKWGPWPACEARPIGLTEGGDLGAVRGSGGNHGHSPLNMKAICQFSYERGAKT